MSDVFFTIAIPAYKGAFLGAALDSCLAQTYPRFEVVVVDDASSEQLGTIVAGYNDSRLHYHRNARNIGAVDVVANWNKCLDRARGDYIICMGDDDRLLPCCLEEYARLIGKYPALKVFHAHTEIIDERGNVAEQTALRPEYETALSLLYHRWNGRGRQFIGDFCFKTADLRSEGGFYFLPMAWGSDDISAIRAATPRGIANTQTPCFQYRINSLTISKSGSGKVKMEAVGGEQRWISGYIAGIAPATLTEADRRLLELIKEQMESHFERKRYSIVRKDMINEPSRLFYWLRNGKAHGLTAKSTLHAFASALSFLCSR